MKLPATPRDSGTAGELATWAVVAFSTGLAAGFLLGELVGSSGRSPFGRLFRALRALPSRTRERRPALIARVQSALAADAQLAGMQIDVVPGGRHRIELRGWVSSRRQRSHAYRLASATADVPVLNCLLVRGEDDRPPLSVASEGSPRSA